MSWKKPRPTIWLIAMGVALIGGSCGGAAPTPTVVKIEFATWTPRPTNTLVATITPLGASEAAPTNTPQYPKVMYVCMLALCKEEVEYGEPLPFELNVWENREPNRGRVVE